MRQAVLLEARYMCPRSLAYGLLIFALLSAILLCGPDDGRRLQLIASALPISILCPLTMLGRSERCAMHELEASCRFSLRFIRMVRLLMMSLLSALFLLLGFVLLRRGSDAPGCASAAALVTPYLAGIYGCLVITRKKPGANSLYGCFSVILLAASLPFLVPALAGKLPEIVGGLQFMAAPILTMLMFREFYRYIKESEAAAWNLC